MRKVLFFLGLAVFAGVVILLATRRAAPPTVPFERVRRETLVSTLSTNGKVEPVEWTEVTSEREGRIARLLARRGQAVAEGTPLVQLETPAADADLAAAQARLARAQADLDAFQRGGRATDLAEIDSSLAKLNVEKDAAQRDVGSLERLLAQQAATRDELNAARDRLKRTVAEIDGLRNKRAALAPAEDRQAAAARVADAQAALALVRRQIEQATIRAPRAGIIYDLPVHTGEWLAAGAAVGRVGRTDRLKIQLYVDEPDLGKVRLGLPVKVTWDALPGREWSGEISQLPAQVTPLGARQVGEVGVIVDAPQRDLPPGANIDARLNAQVVEHAMTVSKGSLRREDGSVGAFVLEGRRVVWRQLKVGITSDTRAEILAGIKEGEAVALPADRALKNGLEVTPIYP
ncbi:MAG: efflux RND transporter periplasmic adaptor subunit [Bryobacteraceae bacterium]